MTEQEKPSPKAAKKEVRYPKRVLLQVNEYQNKKDLLEVLLKENKTYTLEEVNQMMQKFYDMRERRT